MSMQWGFYTINENPPFRLVDAGIGIQVLHPCPIHPKWVDSSEVIDDSTRFAPSASPKPEVNTCETTITWTFLVLKTWRWSKSIRPINCDSTGWRRLHPQTRGGLKIPSSRSIRSNRHDTTRRPCCRIVIPEVDLSLKWVDSSEVNCDSTGLRRLYPQTRGGLKIPSSRSIRSNRHDSSALLSNRHTGSRLIFEVSRFVRGYWRFHSIAPILSPNQRWVKNSVEPTTRRPCCRVVIRVMFSSAHVKYSVWPGH